MKAIVVTDQAAGTAGMKLAERPEPQGAAFASLSGANYGDVIVEVHASGFTGDELAWPSTWIDRLARRAARRRGTKALAQYIAQRSMMPPGVVERELADLTVAELTIVEIERRQNARTQHRVDYDPFARAYQS